MHNYNLRPGTSDTSRLLLSLLRAVVSLIAGTEKTFRRTRGTCCRIDLNFKRDSGIMERKILGGKRDFDQIRGGGIHDGKITTSKTMTRQVYGVHIDKSNVIGLNVTALGCSVKSLPDYLGF